MPLFLSKLHRFSERYCAFDHCRLPLPWFIWSRRTDASSVLRRRMQEIHWGAPFTSLGLADWFFAAAIHFVRGSRDILLVWRRYSADCRKGYGVSRTSQLAGLFQAVFRYNLSTMLYYRLRLFRLGRSQWLDVYSHNEVMAVTTSIKERTKYLDVWTKLGWHGFCERHGLRKVPIIAQVTKGRLEIFDADMLREGDDIFIKPDDGYASHGAAMLEWQKGRGGWIALGADNRFVTRDDFARFIVEYAAGADVLVQPRLRTHPDLADLAARALINFRIVTLRSQDGAIGILSASLRIPGHAEHHSDGITGFFIPVNPADGTLGMAESMDMALGPVATHPVTGARIAGRGIDQWPEMREQALAAHALMPAVPCVGWDLVPTDSGSLILEANVCWSGNLTQHRGLSPLGETAWPAEMLAYLQGVSPKGSEEKPDGVRHAVE